MESKIRKLKHRVVNMRESDRDLFIFAVDIMNKVNEIIDHLNSQSQPEEKLLFTPNPMNRIHHFPKGFIEKLEKDTPEELIKRKLKEITTSERAGFLYEVGDDDLLADELYDYIKQLLDEREREVLEDIKGVNNEIYEGRTEILEVEIDNRLDKLNNK